MSGVTSEVQTLDTGLTATVEKQRVEVGSLTLTRKWQGSPEGKPRVVLVHGFAQNRYTWHGSGRSASAWLAVQGFDVWNFELRGHGLSRGDGSGERFEDYVADAERVYDTVGPSFWVGHSLGGAVSYALATRRPVRGVCGIGALYSFAQANRTLRALCQVSDAVGRFSGVGGRMGPLNVRTRLAGQLLGKLYGISDIAGYAFPISGWAPGSIEPDQLAERLERGFDWTSLSIWLDMARWGTTGVVAFDDDWRQTDRPLLVIAGDLDHLMLPADARVAYDRSGSSDKTWLLLDDYTTGHHFGHLDLVSGKFARPYVWEPLRVWMSTR